jgi:hypothetical protein
LIGQYFLIYSPREVCISGFCSKQGVISVGEELRDEVRRRYAGVALSVREGERSGC